MSLTQDIMLRSFVAFDSLAYQQQHCTVESEEEALCKLQDHCSVPTYLQRFHFDRKFLNDVRTVQIMLRRQRHSAQLQKRQLQTLQKVTSVLVLV